MKRVLVTGATGFIGRHTLPLLIAKGYEVHAVSSQPEPAVVAGVHWHRADLLDPATIAPLIETVSPTHLLHMAWIATPKVYPMSMDNLRWVQASIQLLEAFAARGGERVVLSGSCSEYDWRYGFCSEERTPLASLSLYGTAKHALHLMATSFAGSAGLSLAWGRIFFLFGPGEPAERFIPLVMRSLLKGEAAVCPEGRQMRDYLYVTDVADAFVSLLDSNVEGAVNVASGQPLAVQDIVRQVAAMVGRPELVRQEPPASWATAEPMVVADVRRLERELGWSPKVSLTDGLTQTLAWWQARTEG